MISNKPQFANNQSAFYGAYTRLLYHLFGLEGPFEIFPEFQTPGAPLGYDEVVAFFTVKSPASLALDFKRKQVHDQMRDYFRDLRHSAVTPRLPAICAFGTRLCFYEYAAANNTVVPASILAEPVILNDLAPAERWNCDLYYEAGIAGVCKVVHDIKEMCQVLAD
ncbi:hypothetical protein BKA70DRAFT_1374843 [Coprinopsis sp. MPI-PUGE-AT-0042]|nr:hypothetical protein BKA70DRAFT_1374843 [Coprinopsis sp. MPI-PUGE-AT-0042]